MRALPFLLFTAAFAAPAHAFDWGSVIQGVMTPPKQESTTGTTSSGKVDALSGTDINAGLKEALTRGAEAAVAQLGAKDGFYGNAQLRIPLPKSLKKVDRAMRMFGMSQQADDLVLAMNRAAEAAVPEAKTLMVDAVKSMSLEDAKGILTGGETAATDFFRKKTETPLGERFAPLVKASTDQVGLAQVYNRYAGAAAQYGLVQADQASIEQYVTGQALDRLYRVVGEQEKALRANPLQAGSDLLRKVFGAVTGQ